MIKYGTMAAIQGGESQSDVKQRLVAKVEQIALQHPGTPFKFANKKQSAAPPVEEVFAKRGLDMMSVCDSTCCVDLCRPDNSSGASWRCLACVL